MHKYFELALSGIDRTAEIYDREDIPVEVLAYITDALRVARTIVYNIGEEMEERELHAEGTHNHGIVIDGGKL